MKRQCYEAPDMEVIHVELEKGFMRASVFEPENNQDDGVTITGHEIGNTGDYSNLGWDGEEPTNSTWGN